MTYYEFASVYKNIVCYRVHVFPFVVHLLATDRIMTTNYIYNAIQNSVLGQQMVISQTTTCCFMFKYIGDGFTYRPYDQDVPEGTNNVTFMCRFAQAIYVGWLINETGTNQFLPAAITTGSVTSNGDEVSTLTIAALPEYNETVVGCLATLPSHELCLVNATLLIRGVCIARAL